MVVPAWLFAGSDGGKFGDELGFQGGDVLTAGIAEKYNDPKVNSDLEFIIERLIMKPQAAAYVSQEEKKQYTGIYGRHT